MASHRRSSPPVARALRVACTGWGLLVALLLASPLAAQGAGDKPDAPRPLCFHGARLPTCSSFVVVEVQGVLPLLVGGRPVRWFGGHVAREAPFDARLQ